MAHIENLESIIQEYKSTRKAIFSDEKDTKKCASQTQEEENKQPDEVHKKSSKEKNIPIAEKILLTLEEAALLTGIGRISFAKSATRKIVLLCSGMVANGCLKGKN